MKSKRSKLSRRGQGIVEYVLVTALVSLAAIAMFRAFRDDLSNAYRRAGEALVQGVDDSLSTGVPGE